MFEGGRTKHMLFLFGCVWLSRFHVSESHGAVTFPPPRNAIDSNEEPWIHAVPTKVPFEPWCPFPSATASRSDPGRNLTGSNGQACFWFSNGCAIGCETCDGSTRGPIPAFEGDPLRPVPGHIDSGTGRVVSKEPICPEKKAKAAICDPKLRTVNTAAECGAQYDFFYYSPWRNPGTAAVIDACGTAGGRLRGQGGGGYGAVYTNTTHASQGDYGSETLPHLPSGINFEAGSEVEVAWTLQANHGGGYAYRLCPVDEALTEACFQRTYLDFSTNYSTFRWGGVEGARHRFDAFDFVSEETGAMWRKNPVPRAWRNADGTWANESNHLQTGEGFQPLCPNEEGRTCTGMWGPYNLEIVDKVRIPSDLKPGAYVLGWRWDCEESNQIWSSCSDVNII